jgi:hypothetical protein
MQKVVVGGWKNHGSFIIDFWFKVDVAIVHVHNTPFMYPHNIDDRVVVRNVVGTCTLWN